MQVTSIRPCIAITRESGMSGMDMYVELGDRVKITTEKGTYIGELLMPEWGIDEEEDDMIYLRIEDGTEKNIGASYIIDIEEL